MRIDEDRRVKQNEEMKRKNKIMKGRKKRESSPAIRERIEVAVKKPGKSDGKWESDVLMRNLCVFL